MGSIERIEHKLNLICLHLGLTVDSITTELVAAGPVIGTIESVVPAVIPMTTTAPVTTVAPPTGTQFITVKDALAKGLKLTGHEIDEQGCFYAKDINTAVPAVTQKNVWKRGKNIDNAVYDARVAEIKAQVAAATPVVVTPTPVVAATLPADVTAAVLGPIPSPGVPGVAAIPLPGAALPPLAVQPMTLESPLRKEVIQAVNLLANRYKVDIETIGELFAELGATQSNFVSLPDAAYPEAKKRLDSWAIALDLVDDADQAVRSMNGNDPTYLMTLMTGLQLGTTEIESVPYQELYRLYQNVHHYQNQLEAHFKKPVTELKANPFQ